MQTKVLLHLLMWRLCFVPTGYIFDLPRSREFCLLWMDWRLGLFACHCIAILQEKQHRSNWFLDVLGISGVTRWIFIATSQDLLVLPPKKKQSFRIWKSLTMNHFRLMKVDPDSPRKMWVFYTHCLLFGGTWNRQYLWYLQAQLKHQLKESDTKMRSTK